LAAFSVTLVAIPLGLGIAYASGAPPMAGITTAIIGGILATFLRGSALTINGPGAGLIAVTVAGIATLNDPGMSNGWEHYLGAVVVAGFIQGIIGLLKGGIYADFLPASVVRGMLAAIGVIIFASQIHIALDTGFKSATAFESLASLPKMIPNINWPIALIAINSLAILIIHPMFINKLKVLHYIPAPILVVIAALPFVFLFDLETYHTLEVWGKSYAVGPKNLIELPNNFLESFSLKPNFSKIGRPEFWLAVSGIVVISSIVSLMATKAIDKLDPYRRISNLNKDLVAIGFITALTGFLGGLPVMTVIVRSSVNIYHGAKTRWANLYHGILVFVIIFFLHDLIQLVPLAALAAILVYTGYRLAAPKMFADTYKMGYEQFVILAFTLFAAIQTGLMSGLILGTLITLLIHLVKSHIPVNLFFKYLRNPQHRTYVEDGKTNIKIKGVSNFTNLIPFSRELDAIGFGNDVILDFSQARVVDHSILEFAYNWGDKNIERGGQFNIIGLDEHITTSQHPQSLKVLPLKNVIFLSNRQNDLKEIAAKYHWTFDPSTQWSKSRFRQFRLFENRSLENSKNSMKGTYSSNDLTWEVCDITFDEGAFTAAEVHHSTVALVQLPFEIPEFVFEKESILHKILDLANKEEIQFDDDEFSDAFSVKGLDRLKIREFFNKSLITFLSVRGNFHVESNKKGLLILKSYRFASPDEVEELVQFSEDLTAIIVEHHK